MLGNKDYIGLTHEDGRVRVARLRKNGKQLELADLFVFDLPNPIAAKPEAFSDLESELDSGDDVFGLDSDLESLDAGGGIDDEGGDISGVVDDEFDMTEVEDDADLENERLMADYLNQFGNKVEVGVHVPFGRTVFQLLKDIDLDSMKKKERREYIIEKLRPLYETELEEDQYAWEKAGNKTLLASCNDSFDLLHLVDASDAYFEGKTVIKELVSDESIWMGLARSNYDLTEDDVTGLVYIGAKSSRVIFMQGDDILSVIPVITEGENKETVLNTVFSKILFEFDKGELPKLTNLLLVGSTRTSEKAKAFFEKQFDNDVDVDYLMPNPDLLTISEDLTLADEQISSPVQLQPYLTTIGAAWAASGLNQEEFSNLSLLPEYIREKQKVFKLEWHGAILLLLIALTPMFLNNMYNNKSSELRSLEQQVQMLDNQISDIQPIATMTEDLMADQTRIQSEVDRILDLAEYSQRWSETLRIINHGVDDINNLWVRSIRSDGDNLIVNGVSLGRVQIPEVSTLFTNANIEQVRESEMREQPVYDYSINVHNVLQDIDPFLLDMPDADFDPEELEHSIELSGGTPAVSLSEDELEEAMQNGQGAAEGTVTEPETPQTEEADVEDPLPPTESPEEEETVEQEEEPEDEVTETEVSGSYGLMGPEESIMWGAYTIVIHSFLDSTRAAGVEEAIREEGFKTTLWKAQRAGMSEWWRIGVGQFETISDAENAKEELPEVYNKDDNYIIRIRDDF